jgi:hypothetical protein
MVCVDRASLSEERQRSSAARNGNHLSIEQCFLEIKSEELLAEAHERGGV